MKPFNLEEAKAGKLIVARNGEFARFVVHVPDQPNPVYRVITMRCGGAYFYNREDGSFIPNGESSNDLLMAPEKRTFWVEFYDNGGSAVVYRDPKSSSNKHLLIAVYGPLTFMEGEGLPITPLTK